MAKANHHVTRDIRSQICAFKASGWSQRKIAKYVGCHPSTISRELQRNRGGRGYRLAQADRKAVQRRSTASRTAKKITFLLAAQIIERIEMNWSPEQISGFFKRQGIFVSTKSIYRMIWAEKENGGLLYTHLRHRGKRYNRKSPSSAGRGCIPGRVDISERPAVVEKKSRLGDWEGDTIIGKNHQGTIVSLVDRCSKFTQLKKIKHKRASFVQRAIVGKMKKLSQPVLTITFDNGKEFALHKNIGRALNASCYFATPYHSWERGLNEHTNGLVRQYLPKLTDLNKISDWHIQKIEDALNSRPRKVLGYKTPSEVFYG